MSVVVFLGNKIGNEGAKAIGAALMTNETVTTVDLSGVFLSFFSANKIGVEGAKAIGEALKTNKTVTTVDLSGEKYN